MLRLINPYTHIHNRKDITVENLTRRERIANLSADAKKWVIPHLRLLDSELYPKKGTLKCQIWDVADGLSVHYGRMAELEEVKNELSSFRKKGEPFHNAFKHTVDIEDFVSLTSGSVIMCAGVDPVYRGWRDACLCSDMQEWLIDKEPRRGENSFQTEKRLRAIKREKLAIRELKHAENSDVTSSDELERLAKLAKLACQRNEFMLSKEIDLARKIKLAKEKELEAKRKRFALMKKRFVDKDTIRLAARKEKHDAISKAYLQKLTIKKIAFDKKLAAKKEWYAAREKRLATRGLSR